jgi:hypothetical protein
MILFCFGEGQIEGKQSSVKRGRNNLMQETWNILDASHSSTTPIVPLFCWLVPHTLFGNINLFSILLVWKYNSPIWQTHSFGFFFLVGLKCSFVFVIFLIW